MTGFLAALGLLTILPVPGWARQAEARARAAGWCPAVGVALGGALVLIERTLAAPLPPLALGAVLTGAWALLTGFFHLDGVADSCDALLAPGSRERRLEILRDPRVGAFGATGLTLHLILKAASLAEPGARGYVPLLLAPALGRWLALLLALLPPARPDGLGREFGARLRPGAIIAGALAPALLIAAGGARALVALALATAVAAALGVAARRRLGGVTGDVLGLGIEAAEVATLLVFSAAVPA